MMAIKLALVALLVLLAAQISGWRLLDGLFYALVGLGGLAYLLSRLSRRGLRLERAAAADRGQVGERFSERLQLSNADRLPKLWVEVEDLSTLPGHRAGLVTRLGGRGAREWTVSTALTRRGRYRLGPARLRAGDPFGLFPTRQLLPAAREVLVYPASVPLTAVPLSTSTLPGGRRLSRPSPQLSPSVGGVRDYAPGDGFNRIAWSATARMGRLMVKEFELDPTTDVWLVLDMAHWAHPPAATGGPSGVPWRATTEEFCVTLAASLAQHLLERKLAVGLLTAAPHLEVIPTDRGRRQLVKLLEALAVIGADGERGLGELLTAETSRFGRHSTLVIITPSSDEGWLPVLDELLAGGVRADVLLVDAGSFGAASSPLLLLGQLTARGVPTFSLRRGDELDAVLSRPPATLAPPPRPWRP